MKVLALFAFLAGSVFAQEPDVTWIKPPKHIYIAFGYVPYSLKSSDGSQMCVMFCKDKKGDKIMVGIDLRYIKAISDSFLKTEINW